MPLASHGTIAALEVGGASTQITFAYHPQLLPPGGGGGGGGGAGTGAGADDVARRVVSVEVGGHAYGVYTHSYLGLGQDEVRNPTRPFHTKVKISVNRVFSTTFAKRCEAHPGDFFEFSDRNFTAIFPGRNPHIPVRPSRSKLLKPGYRDFSTTIRQFKL